MTTSVPRTAIRPVPMVNDMSGEGPAPTSVTEPASRPPSTTFPPDWIPAVATGAAFFMIVLDTSRRLAQGHPLGDQTFGLSHEW